MFTLTNLVACCFVERNQKPLGMHAAERPSCSVLEIDAAHSSPKKKKKGCSLISKNENIDSLCLSSKRNYGSNIFFLSFAGSLVNQLIALPVGKLKLASVWQLRVPGSKRKCWHASNWKQGII
jgi:hypothetical protein